MSLKIDLLNHILPKPFFEKFREMTVNKGAIKRWLHISTEVDGAFCLRSKSLTKTLWTPLKESTA